MTNPWWTSAKCRDADYSLFITRGQRKAEQTIRTFCSRCYVRDECLAAALTEEAAGVGEPRGIRGGATARQRKAILAGSWVVLSDL